MPDWNLVVREQFRRLQLPPEWVEEVIAELAAHLEEQYEEHLAGGLIQSEAFDLTLKPVNWSRLAKDIESSKGKEELMNRRTKQIWFPSLLSLTASIGWMTIPGIPSYFRAPRPSLPYLVWMITLPLVGATVGYLSRRAGSTRAAQLVTVLLPAIVMCALWVMIISTVGLERIQHPLPFAHLGVGFLIWVVLQGAALLCGALLFWKLDKSLA